MGRLGVLGRPQALLPAGMLASSPLSVVGREKKDHLKALIQLEFTMPGPGYPREKRCGASLENKHDPASSGSAAALAAGVDLKSADSLPFY